MATVSVQNYHGNQFETFKLMVC